MDYAYSYHYDAGNHPGSHQAHGQRSHPSTHSGSHHPSGTTGPTAVGGSGGSVGHSHTKKDKRRQSIAFKLNHITELFESERDFHYREMLHALQSTLSSLHAGTNDQFLETLTDTQENRDYELVRLGLWETYQIATTQREFEQDTNKAQDEYEAMTRMVKDRLVRRIEGQKKSLREDKALLDMANDHNFLLNGSYGMGMGMGANNLGGSGAGMGAGSGRGGDHRDSDRYYAQPHLTRSNNNNNSYLNGSLSAGGGASNSMAPTSLTTGMNNYNGSFSDSKGLGTATPGSPGGSGAGAGMGVGGIGLGYGLGDRRSLRNRRSNNPNNPSNINNINNNESLSGLEDGTYSANGMASHGIMSSGHNAFSAKRRKAANGYRSGNDDNDGKSAAGSGVGGGISTTGGIPNNSNIGISGNNNGGMSGNDDNNTNNPIWSDGYEGLLFAKERDIPTTTPRHNARSYQGVPTLKPDEATEDLNVLRAAISTFRGPAYSLGGGAGQSSVGPNTNSGGSSGNSGNSANSQNQTPTTAQSSGGSSGGGGSRRKR